MDLTRHDLVRLEAADIQTIWGRALAIQGKGCGCGPCLRPGHHTPAPVWKVQYLPLLWLAHLARTPGVGQLLVQVVMEAR